MIEKNIEELDPAEQQTKSKPAIELGGRASTLVIIFCAIAFVLCILLTVAPLSRIPDPVLQLQTPFGAQLAQVGAWLPNDLGLSANHLASQANTNYIDFLALIALAFVIYGLCALFIQRQTLIARDHKTLRLIWLVTIAAGFIYVFTPAMLSHDILAYAGFSRLVATYHANPYFVPILAYPHDPFYRLNYWAWSTFAYGPVWLAICSLLGFVMGPQPLGYVLAFRLFALAAHLLNIWLVITILRSSGQSSRVVTLGALLYAWNPLVLLESSLGGHNDVFMVTFLLAGVLLSVLAEKRGQFTHPRGYLPPIVAFTIAALVKFSALPLIVLFILFLACRALRPRPSTGFQFREAVSHYWRSAFLIICTASIASCLVMLAFYGPLWIGHNIQSIQNSFTSLPSSLHEENSILRALFAWNHFHTLPPHTIGYKLVQIFAARKTWDDINIVIVASALIMSAIWLWYAPTIRTFVLASLATLGVFLIVTPWFYSWYITWLVGLVVVSLPLSQSRIGRSLLAFTLTFSASAFLTYLFKDGYPPFGIWIGPIFLITIVPPLLAFLISFIAWRPVKDLPRNLTR